MIVFVTFLWKKTPSTLGLPAVPVAYGADHVNRLRNMLWRHVHAPHRFILVLADNAPSPPPQALDPRIEVVNLIDLPRQHNDKLRLQDVIGMSGCFRRLWLHTEECAERLRIHPDDTIAQIDLDCVVAAPITDLLQLPESGIRINSYKPPNNGQKHPDQRINGAFQVFRPGVLGSLYKELRMQETASRSREASSLCIGTDQAWMRLHLYEDLGLNPELFTNDDGVYEFRQLRNTGEPLGISPAPRMVFFAGGWDPMIAANPCGPNRVCTPQMSEWVRLHWA